MQMGSGRNATTTVSGRGEALLPSAERPGTDRTRDTGATATRAGLTRTRLAYAAMSIFLVWHTTAMALTVLPSSAISTTVRAIFAPYITLLRLDNDWGFFAPNVGAGYSFRYVIEDANGGFHTFAPADALSRYSPASIWFRDRYRTIVTAPRIFAKTFAESLCRKHAALRPVSVTLQSVDQLDFWPEDRLAGKSPFDPEFVNVRTLRKAPCAAT
jgi:hypothetical protein